MYGLLQDELSKEVLWARFAYDMEPSASNMSRLASLSFPLGFPKESKFLGMESTPVNDVLKQLNSENKKIILYGCGIAGLTFTRMLQVEHIDFYGFCDQAAAKFPDGLLGKPVLSPDELVAHGDEYYVMLAVMKPFPRAEIYNFLKENNYPKDHILDCTNDLNPILENKQYFEFPALYRKGTAFIDGGCLNCDSSHRFAQWCNGEYSSIIAFEPDPNNYEACCKREQDDPLSNFQLINAGLSDKEGTAVFDALGTGSSHIIAAESDSVKTTTIRTTTIDNCVEDRTVGFIKMDIEGAEFDALHGAQNTIRRDKPLLAICVYHLRGDMVAIMDYLHELVPEYRFLLRHYYLYQNETVLYASVDL